MLLRRDFDFLDQGFGGLRVRDLLGCVKHGVELHDLCEALGDDLAVVDVVLIVLYSDIRAAVTSNPLQAKAPVSAAKVQVQPEYVLCVVW